MSRRVSLVIFALVLGGCASVKSDGPPGNNNPNGTCGTEAECNTGQECCQVPGSPVVNGEVLSVCASPGACCDCFGQTPCERCESGVEECIVVSQGVGECQPVACVNPSCTSHTDCPVDEICCTDQSSNCAGCVGSCLPPTADECTTAGWECGGGPYASAEPRNGPWGAWSRRYRVIPLPMDNQGAATVSATFRWQHDAGRPPPHDFAIGIGDDRAPVFQVFGRDGRAFARFGLRLVALERREAYRFSLTIQPSGQAVQARAELIRVRDGQAVLSTTKRLDSTARSIWREQLSPSGDVVGARLDLREFWIRASGQPGRSVAQLPARSLKDGCGTSI